MHGHDSNAKWELVRMVEKEFGLEAIILEEQADMGRTIIEKFENVAELPGYAFVLLTPDDVGGENTEGIEMDVSKIGNKRLKDLNINFKPRARQNVILELGYFYARLRRKRVCCLYKEGVEIPSDISGVIYKKFTKSIKEMEGDIRRELRAVGYDV
jgi:predicted nucleotide-binding protein